MISRLFVYLLTRARVSAIPWRFFTIFLVGKFIYISGAKKIYGTKIWFLHLHTVFYRVRGQNKICLFVSVKLRSKQSKNWHRRFRSFGWTEQISGGTGAQKRWKLRGNGWRVVRWQVRSVGAYRCRMIGVQSLEAAMDVGIIVDAIATAAVAAACVSASVSWM